MIQTMPRRLDADFQHACSIAVQDLADYFAAGRETANRGQALGSAARRPFTRFIVTVAPVHQFVLMSSKKLTRLLFIA